MTRSIELRLVLEIEPNRYSDRPFPQLLSQQEHRELVSKYFSECMADAGIEGIEPIQKGSIYVDAFNVLNNSLMIWILEDRFKDSGLPGYPNPEGDWNTQVIINVGMLFGGYALVCENLIIEPGCCCAFSDIEFWNELMQAQPANTTLWNGHPELMVQFEGDQVTVQEGWEGDPPSEPLLSIVTTVDVLHEAILRAEDQRKQFGKALFHRVHELIPDQAIALKVSELLVGYRIEW